MASRPKSKASSAIKTIALTGGTGFIGRHIIEVAREKGIIVRALTRRRLPAKAGVNWVLGDMSSTKALAKLIDGADAIIHTAGLTKALSWENFEKTNVGGSANLAQAIVDNRHEKPLHTLLLSSLSAREPQLSDYARSKSLSEQVMQLLLSEGKDTPLTILRPPAVYGPMDQEILPLIKTMKNGRVFIPANRTNRFSMIYAKDLAHAALACLGQKAAFAQCYELDDGAENGYIMEDLSQIAAEIFERPINSTIIPAWALKGFGHLVNLWALIKRQPQMLTRLKVNELLHNDWVAKNNKLNDTKFWQAEVKLDEGLDSTINWYKNQRLL